MNPIKIGNLFIMPKDNEQTRILLGRDSFIKKYCDEKSWKMEDLTLEQIMEIRQQDGWKNPA